MFKQRFITSLILIPLIILMILYSNQWLVIAFLLTLVLLCGYEWIQLIPITDSILKYIFNVALLLFVYFSFKEFNLYLYCGLCVWVILFGAILTYPKSQFIWGKPFIVLLIAFIMLPLFVTTLFKIWFIPFIGKFLLIYLFFLVWSNDIAAYVFGKHFGQHKLIPLVSPGKTIEGAFAGMVLVILVSVIGFFIFRPKFFVIWVLFAIVIGVVSIFGDLLISMLKRRCSLKDTGNLIPGHGGILDRVDSLIAATPWFYFGYITIYS